MKLQADITTTEIRQQEFTALYVCELYVNGNWKGNLYGDSREELRSLCDHVKAVLVFAKALDMWSKLQNQETMSDDDAELLSEKFHEIMTKLNEDLSA